MHLRNLVLWAGLLGFAPAALANEQTPSVKDSPLARVREQLTHYDLEPQGTLALLPRLAEFTRTMKGPDAAEAAFLRVAAASDLLFLADFLHHDALRAGLATEFGVAPDAINLALQREVQACAQGLYREPALGVLAALQRSEPVAQPPRGPSDLRRDAQFLRAAAELATDAAVGGRWAAQTVDPCAAQPECASPYAELDPDGRRAFAYMRELSAAAARLERGRGVGDPLLETLWPSVEQDIAKLRAIALRLPLRVPGDLRLVTPEGIPAWPPPHLVVFVQDIELRYAHVPEWRIGVAGNVDRLPAPEPAFPATAAIPHKLPDTFFPTRTIEDFVTAMRTARGETPDFSAALVVETGVTALLPARALVSMRKAGIANLLFAARTKDGLLLGVPVHIVIPTAETPGPDADLKMRVRLGGYSLDVGHGTEDIPRVRDESGWQFDVPALRAKAVARKPRSAAVSFMPDVATEHVLIGLWNVTLQQTPVDLLIQ